MKNEERGEVALKAKSKIIQSPHAKTQYLIIPSVLTRDSQYPFENGGNVEIIINPNHRLALVVNRNMEVTITGDVIRLKEKKL